VITLFYLHIDLIFDGPGTDSEVLIEKGMKACGDEVRDLMSDEAW
jgi:hypothetical protein